MAGPNLQINIGANLAQAVAGLNQTGAAANTAAAGLNNTGTAATNASRGLNSLAPAIRPNLQGLTLLGQAANNAGSGLGAVPAAANNAANGLNRLAPFVRPDAFFQRGLQVLSINSDTAGRSLSRIRPGAGQASAALTDFNRIVQDAPFGILGIGNNITQLVSSFGNLQRSAGGTGLAFRALFSSATGFGGISLIISAITTAVTFASVGFGAWTKGLGNTKKATDDAKKATEDFVESLKSVGDVVGQANGGVQGQITQVQALASVVTSTNKSYEDRSAALRELQQINKNYFGDLKLEESQMGTLTARVNEYTKALVQQAVIKGFESEIGRVSTGLYDQEKALKVAGDAYKRLRSELDNTKQSETSLTGEDRVSQRYITLKKATEEARKEFIKQRDAVEQTRGNFVELQGAMSAAVIEGLKFRDLTNSNADADKKQTDVLKQRIDALKALRDELGLSTVQQRELVQLEVQLLRRDGVKLGFTPEEVEERVKNLIATTRFGREAGAIEVSIPLIARVSPRIDIAGATGTDQIAEDYASQLSKSINTKTTESFKAELDFGPAIANALSDTISAIGEGGDIFGTIFQSIGAGLKSLGTALIAYGVAAEAFKKTFSNPFAAIAAGAGLILAGSLLQKAIPKFADGVTSFAGGLAMVGERGPELVRLPAGSDVIPNNRLGGFSSNVFIATSVLRGEDIYTSYNRTGGRLSRI